MNGHQIRITPAYFALAFLMEIFLSLFPVFYDKKLFSSITVRQNKLERSFVTFFQANVIFSGGAPLL
jgi:hypothetical protein